MPNEPRLQTKDLVLTVPEYQQRTPQEGTVRTVTPTTMTTTTIVSAQLSSAYVGYYVVPEDGNIRGNPAQIKSFASGTSTATIDRTWASTTGVTTQSAGGGALPLALSSSGNHPLLTLVSMLAAVEASLKV